MLLVYLLLLSSTFGRAARSKHGGHRRPLHLSASTDLKGFEGFVRSNPLSDKISARNFHHVEFYCGDSTSSFKRFMAGLGMDLVAKSDLSTGNSAHASYLIQVRSMDGVQLADVP